MSKHFGPKPFALLELGTLNRLYFLEVRLGKFKPWDPINKCLCYFLRKNGENRQGLG